MSERVIDREEEVVPASETRKNEFLEREVLAAKDSEEMLGTSSDKTSEGKSFQLSLL